MAGEKMSKKEEVGMCKGCCGGMCGVCGIIGGILMLVAGVAVFMYGNAMLDPRSSHTVAGVALVLYSLGLLVHALRLCPMCK